MSKLKLNVVGISYGASSQNPSYQVVLNCDEKLLTMPIVIGSFEAQAIAIAIENVVSPRPLTHDLIINIFKTFDHKLKEVFIYKMIDGIFYSKLIFEDNSEIDCRTSDAIAISIRNKSDVYIDSEILYKVGIPSRLGDIVQDEHIYDEDEIDDDHKSLEQEYHRKYKNIHDLESELQNAISSEDYERASEIKKKIENLKK